MSHCSASWLKVTWPPFTCIDDNVLEYQTKQLSYNNETYIPVKGAIKLDDSKEGQTAWEEFKKQNNKKQNKGKRRKKEDLFAQSSWFIGGRDLPSLVPTFCRLLWTIFIHCKYQVIQFSKWMTVEKAAFTGFAFAKALPVLNENQMFSQQSPKRKTLKRPEVGNQNAELGCSPYYLDVLMKIWNLKIACLKCYEVNNSTTKDKQEVRTSRHTKAEGLQQQMTAER